MRPALALSLLLLLVGCGTAPCVDQEVGQCSAEAYAWKAMGEPAGTEPSVEWREMMCAEHPEVMRDAIVLPDGTCYAGLFYPDQWHILVAYTPGLKMSQVALVHEQMHAHMQNLGLSDPDHLMTQYWNQVDDINNQLSAMGL